MKMKVLASIVLLFSFRPVLLAINCPDPVGNCPTDSGYCLPTYTSTSPDSCSQDCGYFESGKLTKTSFWQIVFTGGHVDGPFAVTGYGKAQKVEASFSLYGPLLLADVLLPDDGLRVLGATRSG